MPILEVPPAFCMVSHLEKQIYWTKVTDRKHQIVTRVWEGHRAKGSWRNESSERILEVLIGFEHVFFPKVGRIVEVYHISYFQVCPWVGSSLGRYNSFVACEIAEFYGMSAQLNTSSAVNDKEIKQFSCFFQELEHILLPLESWEAEQRCQC